MIMQKNYKRRNLYELFEHEIHVITVEQCTKNTASLVQIPAGKCEGNNYCLLQKSFET